MDAEQWKTVATSYLPYLSSLLTAIIAALAIVYNRKSTKDTLAIQVQQRLWEKRTDVYLEMLGKVKKENPFRGDSLDGMIEQSKAGQPVDAVSKRYGSPTWEKFESRFQAFASEEMLGTYLFWKDCVNEYTWVTAKALIHSDPASEHHEESRREHKASMKAVNEAEKLLVERVRVELRFEKTKSPRVSVKTGISGVREILEINGKKLEED